MATSGSADWNQTALQIVTRALRIVGALGQGASLSATQMSEGLIALNALVQSWQTDGIRLWAVEWVTKTFTASSTVLISGNTYTCIRSHTASSSNHPVTGADGSTYWRLTGTGGGTWGTGTTYSAIGDFTVDADTVGIERAFIRRDGYDTPVKLITKDEYAAIPAKYQTGKPTSLWLDLQLTPQAYLYYQPDDTTDVLHYHRVRKLEDFDGNSNTPDFPARWTNALAYGLAADLMDEYQIPLSERQYIAQKAIDFKLRAYGSDTEGGDIQITVEQRR